MGGLRGKVLTEVSETFQQRQEDWQNSAQKQAAAALGEDQRPWQLPRDFTGDLLDIAQLHTPSFDRQQLNTDYEKCITTVTDPPEAGTATTADVIALKLQIDRLAAEERAFRARHATLPRCFAHAAARRRGHGHGKVFTAVVTQVTQILAAGGAAELP